MLSFNISGRPPLHTEIRGGLSQYVVGLELRPHQQTSRGYQKRLQWMPSTPSSGVES